MNRTAFNISPQENLKIFHNVPIVAIQSIPQVKERIVYSVIKARIIVYICRKCHKKYNKK